MVVDFPSNETLAALLGKAWDSGKVVASVCHGPVCFANVKDASGEPIVKGRKVRGRVVAGSSCPPAARLAGPAELHACVRLNTTAQVTGFSNSEEKAVGKFDDVPFTPEQKLTVRGDLRALQRARSMRSTRATGVDSSWVQELGGKYERDPSDWASHAIRDGNLITGQNPASSLAVGKLIVEALSS